MPRKRKRQSKGGDWQVDAKGRWRDARGHYVSKERLLDRVGLLGPEEAAKMLKAAAGRVKGKARPSDEYVVMAKFDGVGWRTVSSSHGLRTALSQGAHFMRESLPMRIGVYVKESEGERRNRLRRRGERPQPKIVDFQVSKVRHKPAKKGKRS